MQEYELDTDELDDRDVSHLHPHPPNGNDGQSMPLLVGLIDSANARASLDGPDVGLSTWRGGGEDAEELDLDELAAKRHSGGGLFDSIANMANSILGAGPSIISVTASERC